MGNEEVFKKMVGLFGSPVAGNNLLDFCLTMQRRGFETALLYWNLAPDQNAGFPNPLEIYNRALDFYMAFGLVPGTKYDQVLRDNEELRQENKFLKDTIRELQFNIFRESGEGMQETWREITNRQLELNREVGKNFCELIRQWQVTGR